MNTATEVPNTITVNQHEKVDGFWWLCTNVPGLCYDVYKALPRVVQYEGKNYIKMGWNSDTGNVSYKESKAFAVRVHFS
jgi:hypothetical protein